MNTKSIALDEQELTYPYSKAYKKNKKSQDFGRQSDPGREEPKRKFQLFNKNFEGPRVLGLDGSTTYGKKLKNVIRNQKYNMITFIPIVLFNQFRYFFNLFFLLTALSQFVPNLQTGYLITFVGPLALVLCLTMAKEAYDDYERYRRDKEANSAQYKRFKEGRAEMTPSSDLKVGDIIEIKANQRIPADVIVLYTPEVTRNIFLKTDQLDGETDWKLRKPIAYTQKHMENHENFGEIKDAKITTKLPTENIYKFEGVFEFQKGEVYKESLSLENTLWGSTVLATGKVKAIVIHIGKEMRVVMNSREPRSKMGRLDQEINRLSKLLFLVLASLSLGLVGLAGFEGNWYVHLFRFIILLSYIIPISLRVNLDFAKLFYSYQINHDSDLQGCLSRNTDIPEELGRIEFLLTDKTGTLTQNEMIFKKLSLENGLIFSSERKEEILKYLKKNCEKHIGPSGDIEEKIRNGAESSHDNNKKKKRLFRREKEYLIRDTITAIILCHNVTPIEENEERIFQASSPDEIALVQLAEDLKMKLIYRDQTKIEIENAHNQKETYTILANFPFSSQTKRMGIIVKNEETNRIIFYLKGADTIMKDKVPEKQRGFLLDESESLGREGLRTLVITQKYLTDEEFLEWKKEYDEVMQALDDREKKTQKIIESLEVDMEFLGITGVEDKLQNEVTTSLENLRNAGIKIWMLTGDKIETATCIAISAGIKSPVHELYVMKNVSDSLRVKNMIEEFSHRFNTVLVIDGATLSVALNGNYELFFASVSKAPAVICCRCSPTQKAAITEGIKKTTKRVTCAIGDGGNDVGMIQAAHVGIGIEGKEGKQAALAADFSIFKFKDLNKLLLWHGRLSYKRSAALSNFVIHRGLVISIIQTIFSMIFYNLSMPIYSGLLSLGYSTIFTMFPVFSLILDEDIDVQRALNYPELYKTLHLGRELNAKTFLVWVWASIYQGAVIMLLSLALFDNSYYNIVIITFTSLILSEMLNITTTLNRVHYLTVVSISCSILVYALAIIFLKDQIDTAAITLEFLYKIAFLTIISWVPLHFVKIIMGKLSPTEEQKVMQDAENLKLHNQLLNFDNLV